MSANYDSTPEEEQIDTAGDLQAEQAEIPVIQETSTEEAAAAEPDYKELYQRALAEGENRHKRHEQERKSYIKYALQGFVEELLPVIDNFYRATEHVPEEQKDSPWVTGIQYIQKQLIDVLESNGVREIGTKPGDPFDPEIHEALSTEPSDTVPDHHVNEVKMHGYRLEDRVIRPARVVVSSGPDSETD